MSKGNINWSDHILNFVSVILGVSLAFIISSRSEDSKVNKEFEQTLSAILNEVESDINTFETYQIPDNKEKLAIMQEVIGMMSEKVGEDSLTEKLLVYYNVNNYAPTNITVNSLISSGKLDLISDFDLKTRILWYQSTGDELLAQGELQVNFLMDYVTPWFVDNSSYFVADKPKWYSEDNSDAIMIFTLYTSFVDNKIGKYEDALEEAKVLRDKIKEYQQERGMK